MQAAKVSHENRISQVLNPMLRKSQLFQQSREEEAIYTPEAALRRFFDICTATPTALQESDTKEHAQKVAFAVCLQDCGEEVKGGVPRDLLGVYDADVQDIDILVPAMDQDSNFETRRARICNAFGEYNLRFAGQEFFGENCLELYFSWRNVEISKTALRMENPDLVTVQLARCGAFKNKDPDFDACQLAVRYAPMHSHA